MRRCFSGLFLSALMVGANMAPALANSTSFNIDSEVTAQSVEFDPSLIEIKGRTLTDAEAAEIKGEDFGIFTIVLPIAIKVALASATKSAVVGGISVTLAGGKFIIKSAAGGIIGAMAVNEVQRRGWLRP